MSAVWRLVFTIEKNLVIIKIEIISFEKNVIDLQIKAKKYVPYYIAKNKVVNDYIIPNYSRIFYTNVNSYYITKRIHEYYLCY